MPPDPNKFDTNLSGPDACPTGPSKTSTYIEALAGDHGVHEPDPSPWYWSPDIRLNYGTLNEGKGIAGANDVRVRPHHAGDCPVPNPLGTAARIKVDLYIANPFISVPVPPPNQYIKLIQSDSVLASQVDENGLLTTVAPDRYFNLGPWTPAPGSSPDDPEAPGKHRCLIARCYPNGLHPDGASFHLPDDPHSAQRNIDMQAVSMKKSKGMGAPMPPDPRSKRWEFPVLVGNPLRKQDRVRIHLAWDPKPPGGLIEEALVFFKRHRLALERTNRPPKSFGVKKSTVPKEATITDKSSSGKARTWDMELVLRPRKYQLVTVQFDLSSLRRGDAAVMHGRHYSALEQRVLSGMTWVLLMT
jgi:hypothetical protein